MKPHPDSALCWLPPLQKSTATVALVPRTAIVTIPDGAMMFLLNSTDGEVVKPEGKAMWDRFMYSLSQAVDNVGGYPVFIRSDLSSAKHNGSRSYRADNRQDLGRCVGATMEDNEMKWLQPSAILVRQWLDVQSGFTAFGGHKIGVEIRAFATCDRLLCWHPYWPADSIQFFHKSPIWDGSVEPPDWREQLRLADERCAVAMAADSPTRSLPVTAAAAVSQDPTICWSVDLLLTTEGKWWITDMASAGHSNHQEGCELPAQFPELFGDDRKAMGDA